MCGRLPPPHAHPLGDLVAGWIAGMRGNGWYLLESCTWASIAADFILDMSGIGLEE
jgi:hypothetical protein